MSDNPLADPLAWRLIKAPSLVDLEIMAREVFVRLPENFRALCTDLVIQVEDFATDEVLDEMGIESPFDLMGLFQGVGLPFQSESAPTHMPNMVWLYRRPILDYWAEHDGTLGAMVAHVLVHEIGHGFGLSDNDMEAIEAPPVRRRWQSVCRTGAGADIGEGRRTGIAFGQILASRGMRMISVRESVMLAAASITNELP